MEIPFVVTLPRAPVSVNADLMTKDEIHAKLKEGYNDIEKGKVQDASAACQRFRKNVLYSASNIAKRLRDS
ncbi:MAG: hypothetical protein CVU89_02945 [Firmicutes bacterium HGW-Firmicutes-14]|jgi:hypothetical protein|nr:MAG: hypothetical protein CVU89_02945 [Firmicutes bacterium HGW-Firmicutes-14]